jgi:hypothetical protein
MAEVKPLISIVTVCFNSSKTICKTIPETTHNYNLVMNMLIDNKSSVKYQKFDKIFDNLLLDHLPDYLFNNQY